MQRVAVTCVFVLAFCFALGLVGSRLRGRHGRGVSAVRLLVGMPLLAAHAYGILPLTVLGRTPGAVRTAKLELFWSHRESLALAADGLSVTDAGLLAEILLNVLLFAPMGAVLPFLLPRIAERGRAWRGVIVVCLVACACSPAVELVQWQFRLGLFEFDDVVDNALGAAAGYAVYLLALRRPWRRLRWWPGVHAGRGR